jgi:hypothetical protein
MLTRLRPVLFDIAVLAALVVVIFLALDWGLK